MKEFTTINCVDEKGCKTMSIKIEKVSVHGWEEAIRGMRNPMNSWDKSDGVILLNEKMIYVGDNDLVLMKKLAKAGTDHRKFMRMIVVYVDVTAPLYWWKEADTYKVGTVRNSCSTMHKIAEKEFTLDDFSHEHLMNFSDCYNDSIYCNSPIELLERMIVILNIFRVMYLETKDKKYWWQMIQLLPSSYNQRATLMLNYEVLANMYHSRKNHHLDEWVEFCKWIETLPYAKELICNE